jgi:transposase
VSGKPEPSGEQRELVARLRAVVEAKDAELATLRAGLAAVLADLETERELRRRLDLRVAELERQLRMDSSDSGTPPSRERIGAKERRRGQRRQRDASERERRKDRKPGGQPGHPGKGLSRDPDPDERREADPPAQCRRCGAGLGGAAVAGPSWAQVWDVKVARSVTEYLLPGRECGGCGTVTTAAAPAGTQAGSVCYGPLLNTAAVVLTAFGNVPPERAAQVIGMLLRMPVSAGFVDKASSRLDGRLEAAGFDDAMRAALAQEPVLAADESPVNVLAPETDPGTGEVVPGSAQVMVIRTPGERLVWLRALASRRAEGITALLAFFTGYLIVDGYTAYQQLSGQLAGIQQCCQHVIRRCRAVSKLGPGSLQSWATDVITVLREAHQAVEDARSRGQPGQQPALDAALLAGLRERYDTAVAFGITHNRLRDWDGDGNHPGYTLGCWLRDHAGQVWLFTTALQVEWTSNSAERAVKGPKRHQAVSGYWHTQATLGRWCRIRSYLDSAANHGLTALDAIASALTGKPWLPATPPAIPAAPEVKLRPGPAVTWPPATQPAIPLAA